MGLEICFAVRHEYWSRLHFVLSSVSAKPNLATFKPKAFKPRMESLFGSPLTKTLEGTLV